MTHRDAATARFAAKSRWYRNAASTGRSVEVIFPAPLTDRQPTELWVRCDPSLGEHLNEPGTGWDRIAEARSTGKGRTCGAAFHGERGTPPEPQGRGRPGRLRPRTDSAGLGCGSTKCGLPIFRRSTGRLRLTSRTPCGFERLPGRVLGVDVGELTLRTWSPWPE